MKVAYFGTWERNYPRNEQVISSLRGANVEVLVVHKDVWKDEHKFNAGVVALGRLVAAEIKLAVATVDRDVDAVLVGYPGQLDVWSAKRHKRPVILNAMVSLHDTLVGDRRRFSEGSTLARALREIDVRAIRAADLVVADTAANAAFLAELANADRFEVCFVGAEERLFQPSWQPGESFHVLFVGKLIPLHGIDVVLGAARLLPDVEFRIIGSGQLDHLLRARTANVVHIPWVQYEELPREYAMCGCALGVFGASDKAKRVIPNKAFQALAVGAPLITADTVGARELLVSGKSALLTRASPEELAEAVLALRDDPGLAERIGRAGRVTFEQQASERVLGERWKAAIASVAL